MRRTGFRKPELPPRQRPVLVPRSEPVRARMMRPTQSVVSMLDTLEPITAGRVVLPHDRKAKTVAEQEHMGRVAKLGCILCRRLGYGPTAAEVHHLREGQGGAQRASNFLTIPLCPEHHRGTSGFHGLGCRAFERRYGVGELDLLAETIESLFQ